MGCPTRAVDRQWSSNSRRRRSDRDPQREINERPNLIEVWNCVDDIILSGTSDELDTNCRDQRALDTLALTSLSPLDQGASPERVLELVIVGETAQHDIDRALLVIDTVLGV